jgi:hypothetical protein
MNSDRFYGGGAHRRPTEGPKPTQCDISATFAASATPSDQPACIALKTHKQITATRHRIAASGAPYEIIYSLAIYGSSYIQFVGTTAEIAIYLHETGYVTTTALKCDGSPIYCIKSNYAHGYGKHVALYPFHDMPPLQLFASEKTGALYAQYTARNKIGIAPFRDDITSLDSDYLVEWLFTRLPRAQYNMLDVKSIPDAYINSAMHAIH